MAYLRIVLLGEHRSGKSSAGNTILGESVFKRSTRCELRHGEVAGRRLTVVDSPGWANYSSIQNIPEMDKLKIQNSVRLCPPGPHAAVLTVPLSHEAFSKKQRVALEEHMSLLSQSIWSHAIILFTFGDRLGDRSIEQHMEAGGEHLRWLVDKCGNRYHVFNNEKRDDTQVTQLLEKIEEMVAENRGGHYEVDGDFAERKRDKKHVLLLMTKTERQTTVLKAVKGEHQSLPNVRLMLVGGEQGARSSAGDHILQGDVFEGSMTDCDRQQRRVADRDLSVVICPDWSTEPPSGKIRDVLLNGITLCSPGPHAVLLNVSVRFGFSEAERRSVEEHMELLGDRVWEHALVLFTEAWWLGERRVEEYIESEREPLKWILEKCGNRYHVLYFKKFDITEVDLLMEKVEDMVTGNGGHFECSVSREDRSVRDTGHLRERDDETRQKTLLEKTTEKNTITAEEWYKREEELRRESRRIQEESRRRDEESRRRDEELRRRDEELKRREEEVKRKEEELPFKRSNSLVLTNPSMSGGTPSEAGSSVCLSPDNKVHDWLKRYPGPNPSLGYESDVSSEFDAMSLTGVEEQDQDWSWNQDWTKQADKQSEQYAHIRNNEV